MRKLIFGKTLLIRAASLLLLLLLLFTLFYFYLDRELTQEIQPARFTCLEPEQGYFSHENIQYRNIYGIGLAYAKHINETASNFDPSLDPPVFRKHTLSMVKGGSEVTIPRQKELLMAMEQLEPGIAKTLLDKDIELLALLDYEAELAFVLLDSITAEDLKNPDFSPKIGFLVTNDLSARSIAILGEDQVNRYDYWGASKSYPGFTPINDQVWVPNKHLPNAIPCVTLQARVDGELRQKENTRNLIYTPKDMLQFIQKKYASIPMNKGDVVLTGTPGGVIFNVPRWKARLAKILELNRFQKLEISQKESSAEKFLKAGNEVLISAEWLGTVSVTIVE
jgi:2-keto-4-pentenoate hydratase/2-oxohepta-3-ene-1,7-dioic acid hydratase in catechol pathway